MFLNGNMRIRLNLPVKSGDVNVNLFYRNNSQLDFARKHMAAFIENNMEYGMYLPLRERNVAGQKYINYKVENTSEQNIPSTTAALNPAGDAFQLAVLPGKITNTFDSSRLLNALAYDKMLIQMNKGAGVKKVFLKTTFLLPGEIKNYAGNVESISQDRTTITFISTLEEVLQHSKSFEYSVFY